MTQHVIQTAADLGFDLAGIAPAGPSPDFARYQGWLAASYHGEMDYLARRAQQRADPRSMEPAARSVIVLGVGYARQALPAELANEPSRGRIAAYAWSDDYHEAIKPLLFELDRALRAVSGREPRGRAFVDTAPILERSWARAAGLGFAGKNTCLINPGQGSHFFLAGLLTPEELQPGAWNLSAGADYVQPTSPARGTCGACVRCIDVCPTGALPQPYVLDARRCISYLTIELKGAIPRDLRPLMGNWIFGCDLCQDICPWNRRFARPARLPALQPRAEMAAPHLLELLALDEAGFRQRFRRSPVRRAKRRGLLRNVCVALGNWRDPAAVPGLTSALHDHEPLIRGHAAWALGRIGSAAADQALESCLRRNRSLQCSTRYARRWRMAADHISRFLP